MRVFIVEDHSLARQNLEILLGGEASIQVVGSAGSAEDAGEQIPGARPDVVLCDLGLPGASGIELIRRVKAELPEIELLAYTVFEDKESVFGALKAGASGYVLKGATPRELVEALVNLSEGGAPMSPRIARAVLNEFRDVKSAAAENTLTRRERQVLSGIDGGYSYKEIANEMGVSPHTVHGYVKLIYEKLHARGRRDALARARKKGWL